MNEPSWSQVEAARLLIKMLIKDGETFTDALWITAGGSGHHYDPDTHRCACGALDHPSWGVSA